MAGTTPTVPDPQRSKPKPAEPAKRNGEASHWSQLFRFGERHGGTHPAAAAVGILIIVSLLGLLLITVGSGDNTRFIEILLMLLAVGGALYFSFFPPSGAKFALSVMGCVVLASILLNSPIPLRAAISRAFSVDVPTAPTKSSISPANPAIAETVQSFSVPGRYVAVGCDETQTVRIEFPLPDGATLETSDARWINTSNISFSSRDVRQVGRNLVAEGTIRGLPRQMILGIGNCPGGGHGTLVLTGSYRTRAA